MYVCTHRRNVPRSGLIAITRWPAIKHNGPSTLIAIAGVCTPSPLGMPMGWMVGGWGGQIVFLLLLQLVEDVAQLHSILSLSLYIYIYTHTLLKQKNICINVCMYVCMYV